MRAKIFLLVFIVLIFISIFFIGNSDFFKIKSIDIQTEHIACADANQIRDSSNLLGQNIFFINSSRIKDVIKNRFICIKDIQISRNFPNKVSIFASGREPKALLLVLKDEEASQSANFENIATPSARIAEKSVDKFLVDSVGVIFAKENNNLDIPRIFYYKKDVSLGQVVEPVSQSLKILQKVKSYGLDVSISEILEESLLIHPQVKGPRIVFKLKENLDTQLASLQLILKQAKIDEKELEFIDLRFDKPVIILAPKKT